MYVKYWKWGVGAWESKQIIIVNYFYITIFKLHTYIRSITLTSGTRIELYGIPTLSYWYPPPPWRIMVKTFLLFCWLVIFIIFNDLILHHFVIKWLLDIILEYYTFVLKSVWRTFYEIVFPCDTRALFCIAMKYFRLLLYIYQYKTSPLVYLLRHSTPPIRHWSIFPGWHIAIIIFV